MVSPSGGVLERDLDWIPWSTEPCGGGTSDIGLPRRVSEYFGIYRVKRWCGRPPRWAQPTRARQGAYARPSGLCSPRSNPRCFFGCLLAQTNSLKSFVVFGLGLILTFCDI